MCLQAYTLECMCVRIHACKHTYIRTHTHIYIYIHTYLHLGAMAQFQDCLDGLGAVKAALEAGQDEAGT